MAQFDVHRNAGTRRDIIPFVVIVQSSLFDRYARRVVVPLIRLSVFGTVHQPRVNPTFEIDHLAVVLNPLEIVSLSVSQLGEFVVSLTSEGARVADALEEVFTQSWR